MRILGRKVKSFLRYIPKKEVEDFISAVRCRLLFQGLQWDIGELMMNVELFFLLSPSEHFQDADAKTVPTSFVY